jgi:3-hydroxyisobutyrate dehydrogenase-like beta-hydroxyacid dehydrogenase
MNSDSRICLIGFGEVGQTLATDLRERGFRNLTAWDLKFRDNDNPLNRRARSMSIDAADSALHAATDASLVFSAVTASQSVAAAQSVAKHLGPDALFVDLNSASPDGKLQAQKVIGAARYVEAVIMAPIASGRLASPMLLGGSEAHRFAMVARDLGFSGVEVFSEHVGKASAAKMCRSVIIKGLESLLTESLVAARHYAVEDAVIDSLRNLLPGPDWRSLAPYMISRSLLHGARRAEEMREAAITVAASGLRPSMSNASAERHEWAGQFHEIATQEPLEQMLDRLLSAAETQRC